MTKLKLPRAILLLLGIFAASSCLQEEYDMSGENLNLEVTYFKDGLSLPLSRTEKILAKEFLLDYMSEEDSFIDLVDGQYALNYSGVFDMGDELSLRSDDGLPGLKSMINIPGEVDFSIDLSSATAALDSLDAKANLAFNHAHVVLEFNSNLNLPMEAQLRAIPYYDGEAEMGKAIPGPGENPVKLLLNTSASAGETVSTKYWLANEIIDENGQSDNGRCPAGYDFVKFNLLPLLQDIPDSVIFRLTAAIDPDIDSVLGLNPDAVYDIEAAYSFVLPLEFAEDFSIEYSTVIEELPEIVGEVLSYGNMVKFGGTITSSLPLGLDLEIAFLDANGNKVDMEEGCGKMTVKPGTVEGGATETELGLVVAVQNPGQAKDIKSLKLMFAADTDGLTGGKLREDSYLQAFVKLILPEGITYDLSDLEINNIKGIL